MNINTNKALVNIYTNIVDNIVVWDGVTPWDPPEGYQIVDLVGDVVIGWSYVNGVFIEPPEPELPEIIANPAEEIPITVISE